MKKYFLLGVVITIMVSCSKDKDEDTIANTDIVSASIESDFSSDLDFNTASTIAYNQSLYSGSVGNIHPFATNSTLTCGIVTLPSSSAFPRTYIINYDGTVFCNGIVREGTLIITFNNYFLLPGSTMTVQRQNYKINGRKVEGTLTFVNKTTNSSQPTWQRTILNGKITQLNGTVYTHKGTRTVTQIGGFNTPILSDNVYTISDGNHTIIRPTGDSVKTTIIEPLIKRYSCSNISKGKLKIDGGVYATGTLNYGAIDSCDNKAIFTTDAGVSYNITLP